ncbi:hypothetical protein BCV70DRAFT_206505 [Testicularia cyperi]|uniref:UDENN domain-containing protein n=1 Tax=Testicularia cyperi TaxID=1882483 RepID=A0A317XQ81_9BASI|nr:hypothetical protein BCV70DRAFT_206505 [Testicularia cyperi]
MSAEVSAAPGPPSTAASSSMHSYSQSFDRAAAPSTRSSGSHNQVSLQQQQQQQASSSKVAVNEMARLNVRPSVSRTGKHCSFCMLAEFNIDRGSTLSYQYPTPTGYDEHMLAELMLPDGAHARSEDWTFFFLKPLRPKTKPSQQNKAKSKPSIGSTSSLRDAFDADASTTDLEQDWSSDELTYVINLVRTKHDNTVRRGALVKAMAIGTRYPCIEIFKPALLLALDDYFKEPGEECLARLYESVNRLELDLAPNFSRAEKLVLRASDRRDLLEERFSQSTPITNSATQRGPDDSIDGDARSIRHITTPTSITPGTEDTASSTGGGGGGGMSSRTSIDHHSESGRRRTDSTSTFASETRSLKKKLSTASLRPTLGARRGSSANSVVGGSVSGHGHGHGSTNGHGLGTNAGLNSGTLGDRKSNNASASPLPGGRPRDTHFFDTILTYRTISLPIRVPLTNFPEEVGEYSLIKLIQTFSGPQSTPTGPVHPHLHTNGPHTHPIILLFNALITQKRVIFLGYGQPANQVASFVLAACALGSGCGAVLRGFAARAFPYTNLLNLDDLEKVPGYVAGVTNPRFEDLHAWDVLFNVENGKVQVAKTISPAAPPPQPLAKATRSTLPRDGFSHSSLSSLAGSSGLLHDHKSGAEAETDMSQFGALSSGAIGSASAVSARSASMGPVGSAGTAVGGRERSNTALFDVRPDAANTVFMEELHGAIASHYGERYIRSRVTEYVFNFVRSVARHEEHFHGKTACGPSCQPFLNGQLGSGPVYADRDAEMREIMANQMRAEGFRSTIAYRLLCDDYASYEGYGPAIRSFDAAHQIGRLKRARQLALGESDLILETISRAVTSPEQITELLALLPPHSGGLLPVALGLFHPVPAVRDAVVDFFLRLCRHSIGRKFVQSMHVFQRLALARLAQERAEAILADESNDSAMSSASLPYSSKGKHDATAAAAETDAPRSSGENGRWPINGEAGSRASFANDSIADEAASSTADSSLASQPSTVESESTKPDYHPFQTFSPSGKAVRERTTSSSDHRSSPDIPVRVQSSSPHLADLVDICGVLATMTTATAAEMELKRVLDDLHDLSERKAIEEEGGESSSAALINELLIASTPLMAQLKRLNRQIHVDLLQQKDKVGDARSKVDSARLALQNLRYEEAMLEQEVANCAGFQSIYQDIQLHPLEEYYERHPDSEINHAGGSGTEDSEHQLMLSRLRFELEERKRLESERKQLLSQKAQIVADNKAKKTQLESLERNLKLVKTSTRNLLAQFESFYKEDEEEPLQTQADEELGQTEDHDERQRS